MIIAQVCLRLATIIDHSKMCSFITQHNATDVESFKGACNWHADCRNVQYRADVLLYRADCRQRVWGCVGKRFADVNVVDRVAHGGGGVVDNELRCILLMAF